MAESIKGALKTRNSRAKDLVIYPSRSGASKNKQFGSRIPLSLPLLSIFAPRIAIGKREENHVIRRHRGNRRIVTRGGRKTRRGIKHVGPAMILNLP